MGLKRGTYYYERGAIAAGDRYAVLWARVAGLFEQDGRRVAVRPGRMRPAAGPRIRARHAPGLHDPADAAARHDDAPPAAWLGPDPPGPAHSAAVASHAFHVTLMGVGPRGLGMPGHPVVRGLRHAEDPALR